MTYCCKNCGFLFGRLGPVRQCPICDSGAVQAASAEEEERFRALRKELLAAAPYPKEDKA